PDRRGRAHGHPGGPPPPPGHGHHAPGPDAPLARLRPGRGLSGGSRRVGLSTCRRGGHGASRTGGGRQERTSDGDVRAAHERALPGGRAVFGPLIFFPRSRGGGPTFFRGWITRRSTQSCTPSWSP